MNDLFEYTEKMYPELEKVLHNQEQFHLLYDTPPAMQEVFDKIQKEAEEKTRENNRKILKDSLELLPYIYVHSDKYVAIEDVLTLV